MAYKYALRYVIISVDLMSSQLKKKALQFNSVAAWRFIYFQC